MKQGERVGDGMLRNQIYIGRIEVPDYGVSRKGDFDPLVRERIF